MDFTFGKKEKVVLKKDISALLVYPKGFIALYPIYINWVFYPSENVSLPKVLLLVSKKTFKKAHDRNRIKRKLREIYRLNKSDFFPKIPENLQVCISISYKSSKPDDENQMEEQMKNAFEKFKRKFAQNLEKNNF